MRYFCNCSKQAADPFPEEGELISIATYTYGRLYRCPLCEQQILILYDEFDRKRHLKSLPAKHPRGRPKSATPTTTLSKGKKGSLWIQIQRGFDQGWPASQTATYFHVNIGTVHQYYYKMRRQAQAKAESLALTPVPSIFPEEREEPKHAKEVDVSQIHALIEQGKFGPRIPIDEVAAKAAKQKGWV
jgi:hypothetical protein